MHPSGHLNTPTETREHMNTRTLFYPSSFNLASQTRLRHLTPIESDWRRVSIALHLQTVCQANKFFRYLLADHQ